MRLLVVLVVALGACGRLGSARNLTTFELVNSNGKLNGSINVHMYNESGTANGTIVKSATVESQNGTSASNRTEKAWAIFSPDFWSNLLGIFSGNVKIGIHGDLSNVASGNLESRGSVGMSVNGQDMTLGAKFGVGGNLGQGVSNTGSIGAGGKLMAKPSVHFDRPNFSLGKLPLLGNAQVHEVNAKNGNGNWQNIKQYFKLFVDRER